MGEFLTFAEVAASLDEINVEREFIRAEVDHLKQFNDILFRCKEPLDVDRIDLYKAEFTTLALRSALQNCNLVCNHHEHTAELAVQRLTNEFLTVDEWNTAFGDWLELTADPDPAPPPTDVIGRLAWKRRRLVAAFRKYIRVYIVRLRRRYRVLGKLATAILRLTHIPPSLSELIVAQSAWFVLHGAHPPRLSDPLFGSELVPGGRALAPA
jgi:hypothetical protein